VKSAGDVLLSSIMLAAMNPFGNNPIFELAANLVNQTSRHIFLTGKAGTGKTTFLKYIKEHSPKKSVVVAPTGIAAINCSGVTIHSFFQLPFTPFIPVPQRGTDSENSGLSDAYTLLQNLRLHNEKRELFEEIELLIIDEISMVRCDVLDAIDTVLRHVRKRHGIPFGGVQMLYIGDLFQLPPVVQEQEWSILRNFYKTPFFFHAKVLEQIPPLIIELQKIYRQQDAVFIDLLNRVRNNNTLRTDLELLNSRHAIALQQGEDEVVITLTSHNYLADRINAEELAKLPGESFRFDGTVDGDFPTKSYPTEKELWLKEGAQIMFIKNDLQKERRYFNGKLGRIAQISDDRIEVEFPGESIYFTLERETWRNIRYAYNAAEQRIEEEELGLFCQFPIRLAWAITIHKSQGLTFEKVIVDAANSFSAGQVYVALSRCTSLEGIALKSPITSRSIQTDERILDFMRDSTSMDALQSVYQNEKHQYLYSIIVKAFEWSAISHQVIELLESIDQKNIPHKEDAIALMQSINIWLEYNKKVNLTFKRHLYTWMKEASDQNDYTHVYQRVKDASDYFTTKMQDDIISPLELHIQATRKLKKVKKYLKEIQQLLRILLQQEKSMIQSRELLALSNYKQPINR
jgi:hypothetical protein